MAKFPLPSNLGRLQTVTLADPAANTEWTYIVPSDRTMMLLGASVSLAQGITQTPQPALIVDDGTNVLSQNLGASAAQNASVTSRYSWFPGLPLSAGAAATVNTAPIPPSLVLGPGYRVRSLTAGIGANTDYGAPTLFICGLGPFDGTSLLGITDNSTFEGGLGGWTVSANCTISSDNTWAHSGSKSLKLTPTGSGPAAALLDTTLALPIVANASYRLSAWATAAGGLSRNISLSCATFTAAHGFLTFTGNNSAGTMNATAGVWTQASLNVNADPTAAFLQINVYSSNMTTGGGEFAWFDDITVTRTA